MEKCKINDCQNSAVVRGYCERHYRKLLCKGKLEKRKNQEKRKKCEVECCENSSRIEGLCSKHYNRLKKYGQYEKPSVCLVEGCDNPVLAKQLCNTHYLRWKRGGKLDREYEKQDDVCSVEGCNRAVYARNLCNKHWQRKRNYGDVSIDVLKQPWRNNENWNDYFERKTKINKETSCIEWIDYKDKDGYGSAWKDGRPVQAHRVSYEVYIRPIPEGKIICHHCDNPSCVNTDHLYEGTHKDNVRDKIERGRLNIPTGEKSPSSKLTREQAVEIIKRRKNGEKTENIAKDYGISHWTVGDILKGKSWSDINRDFIQGEASKDAVGRIKNTQTKLSEIQVKQIKYYLEKDVPVMQLSKQFGVDKKLIGNIRDNKIWKHVECPKTLPRQRRK